MNIKQYISESVKKYLNEKVISNVSYIAYHGTDFDFDKFKTKRKASGYGYSMGAYFSTSEKEAKRYGKKIHKYKLTFNKLLDLTFIPENDDNGKESFFNFMNNEIGINFQNQKSMIYSNSYFGYTTLESLDKKYKLVPILKRKGFDGIAFNEGSGITLVKFNSNNISLLENIVTEYLNESIYTPKELGNYMYHETNYDNAVEIMKDGFKSGYELKKGEHDSGIFFSPTDKGQQGTAYDRGKNKRRVRIEVSTVGLKLLDTGTLPVDDNLPSYKQQWFTVMRDVIERNIFPKGYDGILSRSQYDGGIYEIVIKPEIANKNMTGKVKNLRGKYIQLR